MKRKEIGCDYCGKRIRKRLSEIKRTDHSFCSKECRNNYLSENRKGKNNPNKKWTKRKVIEKLKKIAKELGTSPKEEDISWGLKYACNRYFGSFNKAKKAANLEIYRRSWSEKELQILRKEYPKKGPDIGKLKEKYNRSEPAIDEMARQEGLRSRVEKWTEEEIKILKEKYPKQGSNIPKLLEKGRTKSAIYGKARGLGIKCRNSWNKKKIKKRLKEIAKKLGHSPTSIDLEKRKMYDLLNATNIHFGSFNKAKKEAGLEVIKQYRSRKRVTWNKEKIIKKLKELKNKLGRSPTIEEVKRYSSGDLCGACYRYFGSIKEARKKAGLNPPSKPSYLEKRIINIIKENKLPFRYVGNGKKTIGNLNPDFIGTNGNKKIIEVFGEVFHNPKESPFDVKWFQTEFGRKAYFSQLGYDCLVIWEHEINQLSDKQIKNKIKNFIK